MCVLPKGVVVVWLTGGNQVLIGRFQAAAFTPTAAQYERYYGRTDRALMVRNTRAELPAPVQAEIKAGTLSTKKWDDYLKTYPWQVAFNVPFPLYRYAAYYSSAERTRNPLTPEGLDAYRDLILRPSAKPRPTGLHFYGTAAHGTRYVVRVKAFDEAETQAAFQALHAASPTSPITLLFTIDKPFAKATMTLQNEAKQIPLLKSPVQVLSED